MKIETRPDKSFKYDSDRWSAFLTRYFEDWGEEVKRSAENRKGRLSMRARTIQRHDGVMVEFEGTPDEINDVEAMLDGHKALPSRARLDGDDLPIATFLRSEKQ